jgi:methyltransferase (TIGR00027 family)
MNSNQVSVTAIVTAFSRAYHSKHDFPKIFDDFLADKLFTSDESAFFNKQMAELLKVVDPEKVAQNPDQETAISCVMQKHTASITLSRARYAEERLMGAVKAGVKQYVILGGGLDPFAFGARKRAGGIKFFEVVSPATQENKIKRIKDAGLEVPNNLHFVPVDFNEGNFENALKNAGYNPNGLSFFSWLGVTYYLPIESIVAVLCKVAKIAPKGSSIVFDYMDNDGFDPKKAASRVSLMRQITKRCGEPMITGFDPLLLGEQLERIGFVLQENLSPEDVENLFFKGRSDNYHAYENVHLAQAVVG